MNFPSIWVWGKALKPQHFLNIQRVKTKSFLLKYCFPFWGVIRNAEVGMGCRLAK